MKAYKLEILIIDFDGLGSKGIIEELENTRFANDCIDPKVMDIEERDIGEWHDEHPLNPSISAEEEYKKLWKP
jgi:hypothetical protein